MKSLPEQGKTREEPFYLKSMRSIFYKILNIISDFDIPEKVGEFQLIDRKVANSVLSYKDKYPFLRSLIASCGYKRTIVSYHWDKREYGKSRHSLLNLIGLAMVGSFFILCSSPSDCHHNRFYCFIAMLSLRNIYYCCCHVGME